jgi:peptide/nickel transport system substrate-binding protein
MRSAIARATAVVAIAVTAAALTACGTTGSPDEEVTTLKANTAYVPANWNPNTSIVLTLEQQAVYESLGYLDPATFEFRPLLAESYELSDDLRTLHLTLRQDVYFTDGTHLDAAGARVAFDYALPVVAASLVGPFGVAAEVVGEYELDLTTTRPITEDFFFWLGIVPIASPAVIEDDPESLSETPVGSGPYVIDEMTPEASITFDRNPEYRDPDAYPFDRLEFTVMNDSIAVANALKSGQINAGTVESNHAASVEEAGFQLSVGTSWTWYLQLPDSTFATAPQLADVRVRQAIAYAFDREGIIENLEYGYGTPAGQIWSDGSPYFIEGGDETYAFDPEKARELMAEAGYGDGFELTMPTTPFNDKYEPVVLQSLADIGITVTYVDYPDYGEYIEALHSGDYAIGIESSGDLYLDGVFRNDFPHGGYPELTPLFEIIDSGNAEEVAAAQQEVGSYLLDNALAGIVFSRPAFIWATVPEITIPRSIVSTAATPLVDIQLAD